MKNLDPSKAAGTDNIPVFSGLKIVENWSIEIKIKKYHPILFLNFLIFALYVYLCGYLESLVIVTSIESVKILTTKIKNQSRDIHATKVLAKVVTKSLFLPAW